MKEKRYLNKWNITAYGLGAFGLNFVNVVSIYALLFMTDYVGMNAGVVAMLIAVSKILDGVTDVFAGTIIDRTQHKMGRARIWMLRSIPFMAVLGVLFFMIPTGTSDLLKYTYFFISYNLYTSVFYTIYTVANNTMQLYMTKNDNERVSLSIVNFIGNIVSGIIVTATYMTLIVKFGDGVQGWRMMSVIYAVVFLILAVIYVLSVKEIPHENKPKTAGVMKDLAKNIKYLLKNKYFIYQLLIMIFYTGGMSLFGVIVPYYCLRILGDVNNVAGTQTALSLTASGVVIGLLFAGIFVKRLGLYKTNLFSRIACCIAYIPTIYGAYTGNFAMIILGETLYYILQGPYLGTTGVLNGKICDYSKERDGVDLEATVSSCTTMGTKVGNALGVAAVGWLLNMAHYDGMLTVQPDSALQMITGIFVWVPLLLQVVIVIILSQMNIDEGLEKLRRIKEKVEI